MLTSIEKNIQKKEVRLFLCKPNRETIAELNEAYDIRTRTSIGGIDELTFKIPYKVLYHHEFQRSRNVDKIKGHYLIRHEEGDDIVYFVIDKPVNMTSNGIEVKEVSCFLLPFQFNKVIVRNYKGTKRLYDSVGTDGILNETLLKKTDWSVDYIDQEIATKYRTFDIPEKTLLELMHELQDAFGAIIEWDTINKKVSFVQEKDIGQNKGLSIEYGKYLKSITEDPDFDNVITRLYVYGKDGLSINKYNPTGTDYIESFDYYIYPFKRDENKNIISHSNYMSDSLCHALLDYKELVDSKETEFTTLLNDLETQQSLLQDKQAELHTLETELLLIEDDIDIAKANGTSTSDLIVERDNKQAEIDSKNSEIATVESDIANINTQIDTIKNDIAIENNFTSEQIIERNSYKREKVWSNEYYYDAQDLWSEGKKQLSKVNQPIINYKIDLIDFLNVVRCKRDWDKLVKGDIVTIKYPNFNISIQAKLVEIDRSRDNNQVYLTIANANDLKNGFLELKDLLQKYNSSSTRLDMSKYKWDDVVENKSQINDIINNEWDATKRKIKAGVNESVEISRKGLTITNPDNTNEMLIAQSGVLALSGDGGITWKHAITPHYIVGEVIQGKLIAGVNLIIDSSDSLGNKTFTVDSSGVQLNGQTLTINGGDNGVALDTTNGLTITRSDEKVRSIFNATDGIKIERNTGTSTSPNWINQFYVDSNGVINANELTTKKIKINDGSGNTLIDANTGTIDFTNFVSKVGKLTADNIDVATFTAKSIKADQIELKGTNITNLNGLSTLQVDADGNVTIRGSLTITGGSGIGNFSDAGTLATKNSLSYSEVTGTKPPTDADKTSTTINGGLVTTGTIELQDYYGTTKAGVTAQGGGDTSVRFWAGETFSYRDSAPFRVLQSGKVVASNIEITGGSIDVTTNASIGRYLYLNAGDFDAGLQWNGSSDNMCNITYDPASKALFVDNNVGNTRIEGTEVYANSQRLDNLSSQFASSSHSHSEYASSSHTHGNTYTKDLYGQNLAFWYNSSSGNLGIYVNGSLVKSI